MEILKAQARQELGKKTKSLRKKGIFPAVIYGEKIESKPISVGFLDFKKVYRAAGESSLITVEYAGTQYPALIHGISYDPIKGSPIHADFYAVQMDRKIRTSVPIAYFGESPAVKNEGGVLVKVMHEVEVEALPLNLPHEISVDLSALGAINSRIFTKDIALPENVLLFSDSDAVIALVDAPRTEEEIAEAAEVSDTAVSEVQTEQEVKRAAKAEESKEEIKGEKREEISAEGKKKESKE